MSKANWVCATCGQDFTRIYSANRHNNHFHYGNGIIVRVLEYVIGRINGQFPTALSANNNNSSTRISRKWWHNKNDDNSSSPFIGNNNNNNSGLRGESGNGGFTTIPDQTRDKLGCGTLGQPIRHNNNVYKYISKKGPPQYRTNPFLQSLSSISADKSSHTKQSDPFEEFQERITKIAEIKMLLTPYSPHQEICNILQMLAVECINSGNDNFLDQNLKKVRQTVKIRQALDQLSSPDLPLPVNSNNNMATDRPTSLIGNSTFIAQNNFQNYRPYSSSPSPPQQPQQQGQNFQSINLLSLLLPPKNLDEINNWRPKIPPEPIRISDVSNNSY
jgi:hypothetical protein